MTATLLKSPTSSSLPNIFFYSGLNININIDDYYLCDILFILKNLRK